MMKKIASALVLMSVVSMAQARDDVVMLPLANVIQMGLDQGKLDGSVKFYLSGAPTPKVSSSMGDDVSNKKTNGVGKDDAEACNWVALSVLMAFESSAKKRGANAVVDLHSFYKKNPNKDAVNFECHAGNIMAGVALKGTYAKIGK